MHPRARKYCVCLCALTAACVLFAAVPSFAATNSELRAQIATLERRLADYPQFADAIAGQLASLRKQLRDQLQGDFDYLRTLSSSDKPHQQDYTKQLTALRDEINDLNAKLLPQTAHSPATASGKSAEASPAPAEKAATRAVKESQPAAARLDQAAPPDTTAAQRVTATATASAVEEPAPASQASDFAAPQLAAKLEPSEVRLVADISRDWNSKDYAHLCSNKPGDQTSDVWKIRISAVPLWPEQQLPTSFLDRNGNLYLALLTRNGNAPPPAIAVGSQTYIGSVQTYVRKADLVFEHLTLSQASDLVEHLTANIQSIVNSFAKAGVSLSIVQIAASSKDKLSGSQIYSALTCDIEPAEMRRQFSQITGETTLAGIRTCEISDAARAAMKVVVTRYQPSQSVMTSLTWDSSSIDAARRGLKMLADNRLTAVSTDSKLSSAAFAKGEDPTSAASQPTTTITDSRQQLLLIDNPCLTVSVDPLLSGEKVTPALNFRYAYNYFSPDNALVVRLRGTGQAADTMNYFNRLNLSGDGTTLIGSPAGWQIFGGAMGNVSLARRNNSTVNQWTGGGQFQLKAPTLPLFNTLTGADNRPTLELNFGGTGGDSSGSSGTDFQSTANFSYSFRATTQVSVDLKAKGGWSNVARYAGKQNFAYFSFVGRYNVKGDWDYQVTYQCGRLDPDYIKFCGWQTGVNFVAGR